MGRRLVISLILGLGLVLAALYGFRAAMAELLLDEADAYGEVHLSQSSLATLLGASRQSVNEALSDLRRRGMAETGYRRIRVVDRDALTGVVGRD